MELCSADKRDMEQCHILVNEGKLVNVGQSQKRQYICMKTKLILQFH